MPIVVNHPLAQITFADDATAEDINAELIRIEAEYGDKPEEKEAYRAGLRQGVTSTGRGIEDFLPEQLRDYVYGEGEAEQMDREEFAKEFQARVLQEQDPYGYGAGRLVGDFTDPVGFLLPFEKFRKMAKGLGTVGSTAAAGVGGGAIAGLLEPVREEFGDSMVFNVLAGAGLGGLIGGAGGTVVKMFENKLAKSDALADETQAAVTAVAQKADELETQPSRAVEPIMPTEQPQLAPIRTKPAPTLDDVRVRLQEQAVDAIDDTKLNTLRASVNALSKQISKLETAKPAKGTSKSRREQVKAETQQQLDNLIAKRQVLQNRIDSAERGAQAQRDLRILDRGNVSQLSKETQGLFGGLEAEGIAQPKPLAVAVSSAQEKTISDINERIANIGKDINPQPKQIDEVAEDVADEVIDEAIPIGPERLGLDPLASAGSMGTRPSARFAGVAGEGVEGVTEAVTQVRREGQADVVPGIGKTEAEQKFHSRLQDGSAEQLARLKNETHGRYTWDNVTQQAVEVEGKILRDYNSLVEWLVENDENIFKASELEVLTPLIEEASKRMFDARKILYQLGREGNLDSELAVTTVQDLQFYNYIVNAAYIANRTKVSNAMTQLRKMKRYLTNQTANLKAGKEIDEILFGVKC